MDNLQLNIISAATAKRTSNANFKHCEDIVENLSKPKKKIISFEVPVQLPVRMLSSGVVFRHKDEQNKVSHDNIDLSSLSATCAAEKSENLYSQLLKRNGNIRLRSPFVRKRLKSTFTVDSRNNVGMTRNCAQHFKKIMEDYKPEVKQSVDPSYSVRRIVQKSGLLEAFGKDRLVENRSGNFIDNVQESSDTSEISKIGLANSPTLQAYEHSAYNKNALEIILGDNRIEHQPQNEVHEYLPEFPISSYENSAETSYAYPDHPDSKQFTEEFAKNIKYINSDLMQVEFVENVDSTAEESVVAVSSCRTQELFPDYLQEALKMNEFDGLIVQETYEMEMINYSSTSVPPSPLLNTYFSQPSSSPKSDSNTSSSNSDEYSEVGSENNSICSVSKRKFTEPSSGTITTTVHTTQCRKGSEESGVTHPDLGSGYDQSSQDYNGIIMGHEILPFL